MDDLTLEPMSEAWLDRVTEVAVDTADPHEVMPPIPPDLADDPAAAFRRFQREQLGARGKRAYVIARSGQALGVIRLDDTSVSGELETGLWLSRAVRGQGVGTRAIGLVLARAHRLGADTVRADTAEDNVGAQTAMRRNGAVLHRRGDRWYARFDVH